MNEDKQEVRKVAARDGNGNVNPASKQHHRTRKKRHHHKHKRHRTRTAHSSSKNKEIVIESLLHQKGDEENQLKMDSDEMLPRGFQVHCKELENSSTAMEAKETRHNHKKHRTRSTYSPFKKGDAESQVKMGPDEMQPRRPVQVEKKKQPPLEMNRPRQPREPQRLLPGAVAVRGPDAVSTTDGIEDFTVSPTETQPPEFEDGQGAGRDTGLAVAMAVGEDELNPKLPTAIEYDPDAKLPLYRNRRFQLYALVGVAVLIAVVAAVVAAFVSQNDPDHQDPTPVPTPALEGLYRQQFVNEVGEQVNVVGSPYDRAADWIMFEDPLQLPPDAPNLIQRYQLVLLYFLTTNNGEKRWNSCNPPLPNETDECVFQEIDFNNADSLVYTNISGATRWMAGSHECEWIGTFCDDAKNLITLQVSGQNITDPLPTEISTLPYLQAITFYHNEFTGTIPEVYANMKQLASLELQYNFLTGTVPDVYWRANALQRLNLGSNFLSGTISTEVGTLDHMKGMFLFDNKLRGTIPSEIGKLEFLSYIRLGQNDLVGQIPTEMGNLSLLRELWLWENGIEGKIPSELGLMKDMENMEIYENRFTGTIPEEIYNLTQMYSFDVNKCRLTGTLSTRIGQLTKMQRFRVSTNDLTGTIPAETANLTSIVLLWFHKTLFTGTVPDSLCRSTSLQVLQADCNPPQNPSVPCQCCSHCCERESGVCFTVDNN